MEKGGVPFWNSALSSILHKALRSHGVVGEADASPTMWRGFSRARE